MSGRQNLTSYNSQRAYSYEHIIAVLKSLKNQNEVSDKNYDNLHPSGSKPGMLYELPTFPPILSAICTLTYKLSKLCDKLLKVIATNGCTINDSS